jgi:two-component system, NarL family, response regulator DesR
VSDIRVVLAEDQAMVRGALVALLELEEDIRVVGQASSGEEAWELLRSRAVDVLVTDVEMPGLDGLALAQRVKEAGLPCKVVVLTTFARPGYLRRALDAGAAAYLLKDAPAEQLAAALRKVREGGVVVAPELAVEAWAEANPLTEREREVLRLAGEGMSGPAIAGALSLSAGTVRNYLSEAIGKLGAGNRIEAYRLARDKGWV